MIVRIDFHNHHQDRIDNVYTWLRVDRSYWQGPNHLTAWNEEHFLEHIRELVTYRPPPTPEERAKSMQDNCMNWWGCLNSYQSESLREEIAKEIKSAIAADREAR